MAIERPSLSFGAVAATEQQVHDLLDRRIQLDVLPAQQLLFGHQQLVLLFRRRAAARLMNCCSSASHMCGLQGAMGAPALAQSLAHERGPHLR